MDENEINEIARSLLNALQTAAQGQANASNQAAGAANNLKAALVKIATGGQLTADELKEVAKASGRSASNLEDLNKAARNTVPSITGLAGSLARGNAGFGTLNGVIENTASLIGGLAGLIPVVGTALKGVSEAAGKTATFMIDRFGEAYGSFEKLSQIGAVGADGVGSMVEGFSRLNVPLQTYAGLVSKNSTALALLSGSAAAGAEAFTEVAGKMKDSGVDMRLRTLGFSTEEISDTMIAYADLQRRLGNEQAMTQANLKNGAMAYGKELDTLARLTGKSREQAQQAMNQQLLDARFNAKLREMQASGQTKAARELQDAVTAQQLMGNQQMAQAIMSSATGFFVTPEAQAAVVSMNGFSESVQGLASGMTSAKDFTQQIQDQAKTAADQFGPLAQAIGADSPVTKLYVEQTNLASASAGKIATAFDQAAKDINKAQTAPEERTVNLAKAKSDLEAASAAMSKLVLKQELVTDLVSFTADLTKSSAKGLEKMVAAIKDMLREKRTTSPQLQQQQQTTDTLKKQQQQLKEKAADTTLPAEQRQAIIDELEKTNQLLEKPFAGTPLEMPSQQDRVEELLKNQAIQQKAKDEGAGYLEKAWNAIKYPAMPLKTEIVTAPFKEQAQANKELLAPKSSAPAVAPETPSPAPAPTTIPAAPSQKMMPSAVPSTSTLPNAPSTAPASTSGPQSSVDNSILGTIAANTATTNAKMDALASQVAGLSRGMLS